jgi:AmiR/NasT family two-component response regulator
MQIAPDITGDAGPTRGLRVLAADEDREALDATAVMLRDLGHEVTAYAVALDEAVRKVAEDDPDVAVVVLHGDDQHALGLIDELTEATAGPVIAILDTADTDFLTAAAERGIDAYAYPMTAENVQVALEVAIRRHADRQRLSDEVARLESALERRALIERAKGILMERHEVGEREAFEMLRSRARGTNTTVVSLSRAVVEGHALLPKRTG